MKAVSFALRLVLPRIAPAAAFCILWSAGIGKGQSASAPLVFCGMLYIAAAWFAYLRRDGVRIVPWNREKKQKADGRPPREKWVTDNFDAIETENQDTPAKKQAANLVAAGLLIAASFFF